MLRVALGRTVQMALVLWLVVTVVFLVIHLSPGDPTIHLALDPSLPAAAREMQIERLGLDEPLAVRYRVYLGGLLTGDLGVSSSLYPRTVGEVIAQRLPRTVALLGVAIVAAFVVGFQVGKRLAMRRDGLGARATELLAVFLHTVFAPWLALLAIWLFALRLGWFPSGRLVTPAVWRDAPWTANEVMATMVVSLSMLMAAVVVVRLSATRLDAPRHASLVVLIGVVVALAGFITFWAAHPMRTFAADIAWHATLPTLAVLVVGFGAPALVTRTAMLTVLEEDHVRTARAKGLSERQVRDRHVARNALNPLLASFALSLAGIVTGGIVFETVFSWPGLGLTFLDAVVAGDVPLAAGVLVAYGVVLLALHLVLEVVYGLLDPRLRTVAVR